MYSKTFFEDKDISTVRNNYLLNRSRVRYSRYLDRLMNYSYVALGGMIPKAGNIIESVIGPKMADTDLMDESCRSDLCNIIQKISLNMDEQCFSFWDEAQFRYMCTKFTAEMEAEENKDYNSKIYNSKYLERLPPINTSFNLKVTEKNYSIIKETIKNFLMEELSDTIIRIVNHQTREVKYFSLKNSIDAVVEAFSIDCITLAFSLVTNRTTQNKSKMIDGIMGAVDNLKRKISKDALRKNYDKFIEEGIFNMFSTKYFELPNNQYSLSYVFDAHFIYLLLHGEIKMIESDRGKYGIVKKALKEKIEKIKKICKTHPLLKYHIEQHFMLYSMYNINKLVEEEEELQGLFITSALYDIPFPLIRIELSKLCLERDDYNADKISLSLIEFKYKLYRLSSVIHEKLHPILSEMFDINNEYVEENIGGGNFRNSLFEDIKGFTSGNRMTMCSDFLVDICTILSYNQNSKKIYHEEVDFYKILDEFKKSGSK